MLKVLHDLPRPTGDVDFIEIRPASASDELLEMAGKGSELARKHRIHFHRVTVAEYPENYEQRLIDITPDGFHRLRLKALEVHDLVLAKLSRNIARDRGDVQFLAERGDLDPRLLKERFEKELRPNLSNEAREAKTLELWLGEFLGEKEQ